MKDQQDCVLNVLEELGDKQLFLNHQCSTGIFFLFLLLLPSMLSIDRQTNEEFVRTDSEDFILILQKWTAPSSSRCTWWEWRRRWITFFETSYAERENVSVVQYQSKSFCLSERFQMKSQQVLFFVVLLLPLIDMQNLSHPVVTHVLRADLQELLCRYYSNPSQIYLIHENSNPGVSIVSVQRPNSNLHSIFTMQATSRYFQHGSNFWVSLDQSFWLWWSVISWKSVFTTGGCMKLCQVSIQKSCIHTKFTQFILLWQIFNSFSILLQ